MNELLQTNSKAPTSTHDVEPKMQIKFTKRS